MNASLDPLKVFISSPGGLESDRTVASKVIASVSQKLHREHGRALSIIQWPNDIGADKADYLQSAINQQTVEYDILLCIVGARMGTQTPRASSGTEEEFDRAIEAVWAGKPLRLLLFFSNSPIGPQSIDPYQLMRVQSFKEKASRLGALFHTYSNHDEFERLLTVSLERATERLINLSEDHSTQLHRFPDESSPPKPYLKKLTSVSLRTRMTNPQGADLHLVPLAELGRGPIRVSGRCKTQSKYFRFGFKLLDSREPIFSAGSVQTLGQNILVHVGRNLDSANWFITAYRSGYRLGPDQPLPEDADCAWADFQVSIAPHGDIAFGLNGRADYETFFRLDGIPALALLGWSDEHKFRCDITKLQMLVY